MQFIPLCSLSKKYVSAALKFIAEYEVMCVQLAAQIKVSDKNIFAVLTDSFDSLKMCGILKLSTTVLHCLPFSLDKAAVSMQEDFVASFSSFLMQHFSEKQRFPECVNGIAAGSTLIMKAFSCAGKNARQINDYTLMCLDVKSFKMLSAYPLAHGEKIVRCKKDIPAARREQLLVLQENYEKEEVLPSCMAFNEDACRLRLLSALRTQYVLALERDGQFVSKAATNAVGFKYVQIGGVFTISEFRRNHYSFNTMYALLKKICRMGKKPVLFVKNSNVAANALYSALKFIRLCSYTILYY